MGFEPIIMAASESEEVSQESRGDPVGGSPLWLPTLAALFLAHQQVSQYGAAPAAHSQALATFMG